MMDTTYFGRKYWYMIFRIRHKEKSKRKNVLWYKVGYETNDKYREWIRFLQWLWLHIRAIVCDWRRWLLWGFWDIPVQMCVKHCYSIVIRYLTNKPKHAASIELKEIWLYIWKFRERSVVMWLESWYMCHHDRLVEKNEKWRYKHERVRKAYRSIKCNLQYLYMYERHPHLDIPKTNNSLESINSHLKTKVRIHRWLREDRKDKFIRYYLYIS